MSEKKVVRRGAVVVMLQWSCLALPLVGCGGGDMAERSGVSTGTAATTAAKQA